MKRDEDVSQTALSWLFANSECGKLIASENILKGTTASNLNHT